MAPTNRDDRIQVANQIYHQRGESIMPQGLLPYKYEEEKKDSRMTSLAGLPLYLDLAYALCLPRSIGRHLSFRPSQGWSDSQVILSLMLLALAGGECVDDLKILEADKGFCRIFAHVDSDSCRFRRGKSRTVPSPSAAFRYLSSFRESLEGFIRVNRDLVSSIQRVQPSSVATLDMDATLVETGKKDALFCYEGYKAYQPLQVFWAEKELLVHTEFREGNVPANYGLLQVFKEAMNSLPEGVRKVRLRSDGAGYVHDLLAYCDKGDSPFKRIEFAVSCPMTDAFKNEVALLPDEEWKKLDSKREWAEVGYVPDRSRNSYRYLVIREKVRQPMLPGMELPFATLNHKGAQYKLRGLVSNMDWAGERLIAFSYERCGKSEEAHLIMKEDLAGGTLPSGNFGENAAWWWVMALAFNLNAAMKQLILGGSWVQRRMKAVRYRLINLPGRIVEHARQLVVRIAKGHRLLMEARERIMRMAPSG